MDIEKKVFELLKPIVEKEGYILDEIVYEKEDSSYFLRVIIDKNGFIDIEDCVKVTHAVDPVLDTVDYIKDSYILDVCSKEKGCE